MPFTWQVQPYRWLYELREQYTTSVMLASRTKAYDYARQAEAWMKEKAPWQDRTMGERIAARAKSKAKALSKGKTRGARIYMPGARAGLRVRVQNTAEEEGFKQGMAAAIKEDKNILRQINAERLAQRNAFAAYHRTRLDEEIITRKFYEKELAKLDTRYKKLQSVPKGKSAQVRFLRQNKSGRLPVVYLKFSHHPDVGYGIWLEIANNGRFAIIAPAVNYWGNKFMNEVNSLLNLKQYQGLVFLEKPVTPEESFAAHAAKRSGEMGRPYEPWSLQKRSERARRRPEYDPEKAKASRQRRLEEEADYNKTSVEWYHDKSKPALGLRTYEEKKYEGPTFNPMGTINRRR